MKEASTLTEAYPSTNSLNDDLIHPTQFKATGYSTSPQKFSFSNPEKKTLMGIKLEEEIAHLQSWLDHKKSAGGALESLIKRTIQNLIETRQRLLESLDG